MNLRLGILLNSQIIIYYFNCDRVKINYLLFELVKAIDNCCRILVNTIIKFQMVNLNTYKVATYYNCTINSHQRYRKIFQIKTFWLGRVKYRYNLIYCKYRLKTKNEQYLSTHQCRSSGSSKIKK